MKQTISNKITGNQYALTMAKTSMKLTPVSSHEAGSVRLCLVCLEIIAPALYKNKENNLNLRCNESSSPTKRNK